MIKKIYLPLMLLMTLAFVGCNKAVIGRLFYGNPFSS